MTILTQSEMHCRLCDECLTESMIDLGMSPLCEDFIKESELQKGEMFYPLEVMVCTNCWLAQVDEFNRNSEIFDEDYGYFSSWSTSWLAHAAQYVEMASARFGLDSGSFVVEIASNDGYLLKNFVQRGIPCLGVDPAANVAEAACQVGVDTRVEFFTEAFSEALVAERGKADLVIGNNVLAHTPYLKDFVAGVATTLAADGWATFEFPHLLRLIENVQFDTIYHEHFHYYSLYSVIRLFGQAGLEVVDVEEIAPAGGSLRVFVRHAGVESGRSASVDRVLQAELAGGLQDIETYRRFGERAAHVKDALVQMLIGLKNQGLRVAGYGAPGKGNTLLNYCGIKTDLLPYTCDLSEHKHGRYCPGSRIPIYPPSKLDEDRPDVILILPWNLTKEISAQLAHTREWGARLAVPIPTAMFLE